MKATIKLRTISQEPGGDRWSPNQVSANIARISNPGNQNNHLTADKLCNYCETNGHWSVFEHYFLTIELETSLAIATQILRHRSFCFQQFSMRYAAAGGDEVQFEPIEFRLQDAKNRQNSIEITEELSKYELIDLSRRIADHLKNSVEIYNQMLDLGIAKEVARFVLPTCTQTTLYMTGNIRSWKHYLAQRLHPSAQKEHRALALLVDEEIKALVSGLGLTEKDLDGEQP